VGGCTYERYESYYTLDRQGNVLAIRWRPGDIQSVTDLDGQQPAVLQGRQLDSSAIREIEAPATSTVSQRFQSYRSPGRFSVRCRNDSSSGDERWFYVPAEGRLRGFDGRTKRLIGSCGPDGFIASARRSEGQEVQPVGFFVAVLTQLFVPGAGANAAPAGGVVVAYRVLILLAALACATTCFLLARRYAFSRPACAGWALCGLLFGWAGVVLMIVLQDWPARVRCASCGRPRRVDRESCEHCGAAQARPTWDGTEILETSDETAATAIVGH
jgi:hypothetical protein